LQWQHFSFEIKEDSYEKKGKNEAIEKIFYIINNTFFII
jgi:hypothetical protein